MKSKIVLVAFLMVLFIGPSLFAMSYASSSIVAEQNMTKEFSLSTEYETNSESITSFTETLEDDVLFYPDGYEYDRDDSPIFGGSTYTESGDELSPDYFYSENSDVDDEDGAIETDITASDKLGDYIVYMSVTVTDISIDGPDEIYLSVVLWSGVLDGSSDEAYNEEVEGTGTHDIRYSTSLSTIESFVIWITYDGAANSYINITLDSYYVECMTLADSGHYAESFADVSDWSDVGTPVFASDGDKVTLQTNAINEGMQISGLSITGDYLEVYCYATSPFSIELYNGSWDIDTIYVTATSWRTYKVYIGDLGEITSIRIRATGATARNFYGDYLRISPSNEMGWEHDCSTTINTDASSSDGDKITVTDSITFDIDVTTTPTLIDTSYYPFLDLFVVYGSGNLLVEVSEDGSSWHTAITSTAITEVTHYRANVNCLGIDIKQIRVNVSSWASLDYIKPYSIANYAYSDGSSNTVNDYFYVDAGKLVVVNDVVSVMRLNHDPTLLVAIGTYNLWIASLDSGADIFRFRELSDTSTLWDTGVTGGALVGTTFTDFDILFYGNCVLSAINFYGIVPAWNVVSDVDLVFFVSGWRIVSSIILVFVTSLEYWGFNMILIFLGLLLIPASTIYMAKGGLKEASMTKVFFALVAFILGWAFFVGGIM